MTRFTLPFVMSLLFVSACGSDSSSSDSIAKPSPETPNSSAMLTARQFEQSYRNRISQFEVNKEGHWCFISEHAEQQAKLFLSRNWELGWQQQLHCEQREQKLFSYTPKAGEVLLDIALDDSQQIFVLEAIENPSFNIAHFTRFNLRLSVYDLMGKLLKQKTIQHSVNEKDLLYYDGDIANEAIPQDPDYLNSLPLIFENNRVQLEWKNNQLYLMAHILGIQVYQFNTDLSLAWRKQVLHDHLWVTADINSMGSHMAIDDQGRIAVAMEVSKTDISAFNQHFDQTLDAPDQSLDILVTLLQADGSLVRHFIAGQVDIGEKIDSLQWKNQQLIVAGHVAIEKNNEVGQEDLDAYLYRYDEQGNLINHQIIHWNKEEWLTDAVVDKQGNVWLSGTTGLVLVDTGSQTQNGQGVIFKVSSDGDVSAPLALDVPRDSSITGLQLHDQHLYYRYQYDGPISHTCDQDDSLCGVKSGIGILSLEQHQQ